MRSGRGSGFNGWLIFLAVVGGLFLLKTVVPVVSTILRALLIVGLVLLVLAIILIIYFACQPDEKDKSDQKDGGKDPGQNRNDGYTSGSDTNYRTGGGTSNQGNGYNQNGGNRGGYNQNGGYHQNGGQQPNNGYKPNSDTNYRQGTGSAPNSGTNYRKGGYNPNRDNNKRTAGNNNERPNIFDANPNENQGSAGNNPAGNNAPGGNGQGNQPLPPSNLSPEAMQILTKGRNHLKELRRLLSRIGNLNVKKRGEDICVEVEKILGALQQQPEDIPMVRQFFNYYLPTLGNILLKYLRLEEAGMATEQTTVKVLSCLSEIKVAMEKQYAAIFENDLLDLTVEMEALTQAVKRDGLLVSDDFTITEGGREITLTV